MSLILTGDTQLAGKYSVFGKQKLENLRLLSKITRQKIGSQMFVFEGGCVTMRVLLFEGQGLIRIHACAKADCTVTFSFTQAEDPDSGDVVVSFKGRFSEEKSKTHFVWEYGDGLGRSRGVGSNTDDHVLPTGSHDIKLSAWKRPETNSQIGFITSFPDPNTFRFTFNTTGIRKKHILVCQSQGLSTELRINGILVNTFPTTTVPPENDFGLITFGAPTQDITTVDFTGAGIAAEIGEPPSFVLAIYHRYICSATKERTITVG